MNKTIIRSINITNSCGVLPTYKRRFVIKALSNTRYKGAFIIPHANNLINASSYGASNNIK